MAKYIIEDTTLKNIADAIRGKNGETAEYLPSEMPAKIEAIETGGGTGGGYTVDYVNNAIEADSENMIVNLINDIENGVWINGKGMFYNCQNTKDFSFLDGANMKLTDGTTAFGYTPLVTPDFSNFDTSKAITVERMFYNCSDLQTIDLSNWDMNNIDTMASMFYTCKALTNVKLGDLSSGKLTNMASVFYDCAKLETIDGLEKINMSNVSNINSMFRGCGKFVDFAKIENWDTSKVTSLNYLFYNCLHSSVDIDFTPLWNVENVDGTMYSFYYAQFKKLDLGNLNFTKLKSNPSFNMISTLLQELVLPNLPAITNASINIFSGVTKNDDLKITWGEGCTFGNSSTTTALTLPIMCWQSEAAVDRFVEFANSIAENTTGKNRLIKIHTNLYSALSDEQKALLTDKNYTITFGTS